MNSNLEHLAVLLLIGAASLAFWISAVFSVLHRAAVSSFERGVWIVVAIVLPFLGPLAWFVWGRNRVRQPGPQA
ncbi:PLD nuclease N-terminal domain-containing protein [Lacisediminihabitans sp. FW035]